MSFLAENAACRQQCKIASRGNVACMRCNVACAAAAAGRGALEPRDQLLRRVGGLRLLVHRPPLEVALAHQALCACRMKGFLRRGGGTDWACKPGYCSTAGTCDMQQPGEAPPAVRLPISWPSSFWSDHTTCKARMPGAVGDPCCLGMQVPALQCSLAGTWGSATARRNGFCILRNYQTSRSPTCGSLAFSSADMSK